MIKVLVFMNFMKNLMAAMATRNETMVPTRRIMASLPENEDMFWLRSKNAAPMMVGMANRKENSTIVLRERPRDRPPRILAAALETPGITETD